MLTIKEPDLNAPRYRPITHNIICVKFMRQFRKKFPKYKDVPDSKLREIIYVNNNNLWKEIIENRDGIEFPEKLGYSFIGTCNPPQATNPDYPTSFKHNKRIRHRNFESDNYLAKIFYTSFAARYRFQNNKLWKFEGCREFTRAVGAAYPENWKKYVKVDNYTHIAKMFKKEKEKERRKNTERSNIAVGDYNEFDMD